MIRLFIVFLALTTFINANQPISPDQVVYRLKIKQQNVERINRHNSNPNKSFKMVLYPMFEDKTFAEIKQLYLTKDLTIHSSSMHPRVQMSKTLFKKILKQVIITPPFIVNWTERGVVTPVKNQGRCGSCYAFTALADIQTSYLMSKNQNLTLSTQQILECSEKFGNFGCNGGWMTNVFDYARIYGVRQQSQYKTRLQTFEQGIIGKCQTKFGRFKVKSYRYTSYYINDCMALLSVALQRPVTVAITADESFVAYSQGILDQGSTEVVNHGVQLTGVSLSSSQGRYWMVKNSWGIGWGQNGYARISLDELDGNLCNICFAPSYSII